MIAIAVSEFNFAESRFFMREASRLLVILAAFLGFHSNGFSESSCSSIDRNFVADEKSKLSDIARNQLQMGRSEAEQIFKLNDWFIIHVNTHESDSAYLFYKNSTSNPVYVTMWSGAARKDEGPAIKEWVINNAVGVPVQLAECFSFYVTNEN